MERARLTGEWVLRVYAWKTPTLSFGRNQTASGRYDLDGIHAAGLEVVRRPTGGRAILHDREITYSVTAPAADAGDLRQSYERINRLLLAGLRRLGVGARMATPGDRPTAPGLAPCFDEPSAGELTVDGRKLAGSAQWRADGAILQHGSILVADDQSRVAGFVLGGARQIPIPATLEDLLGRTPSTSDLADALVGAVRELEDPGVAELILDDEVRARASALVVRYVDDAWTWRR